MGAGPTVRRRLPTGRRGTARGRGPMVGTRSVARAGVVREFPEPRHRDGLHPMNIFSALINGPLIAVHVKTGKLHAATDESVMRGWSSPKHPKPRSTVDGVCGVTRLKLVPRRDAPGDPLPWPPTARGPLERCAACFAASSPKRPRTTFEGKM